MRTLYLLFMMHTGVSLFACSGGGKEVIEQVTPNTDSMKVKITAGQTIVTATMYDNPSSRDFISLLPINLTLTDYNNTEKVSALPKRLSIKDAPSGYKPAIGDITFYAPWGNLALFYKDFSYSNGLIVLGKIDGETDVFNVPGSVQAKIELLQ